MSVLQRARRRLLVGLFASVCLLLFATPALTATSGTASASRVGASARSVSVDGDGGELLLVLDSSGSMKEPDRSGTTKIVAAKRSLHTVVGKLPGDAQVGMRVYGATVFSKSDSGACTDSQLVVPMGPVDKPALRREIDKYQPYGETPIAYSLKQAAKDFDAEGQRTILLVSDGEETCDADPCGVARQLHRSGVDLKIDVVGMSVAGRARHQLECIADAGGGTYCESGDIGELTGCLEHSSLRAFRPFSLSGTPVEGGLRPDEAPEIGPGEYTDVLGGRADPDGTKYYSIPHPAHSTLHIGFTAWPPAQGGLIGVGENTSLTVTTPGGATCGGVTALQTQGHVRGLLADGVTAPDIYAEPGCADADHLLLQVRRADVKHGRIPFELVVVEEPALATRAGLPAPAGTTPSDGPPVPVSKLRGRVAGGAAFADAATLQPGTWTDSLQPGEVLFYRVHADWGQRAAVSFRLGPDRALGELPGSVNCYVSETAYGPARHSLFSTGDAAIVNNLMATSQQKLTVRLVPVRYRNRESGNQMAGISLAGDYYFSISMDDSEGPRFQVPLQISVAVDGQLTGQPEYAEPPTPTATAEPSSPTRSENSETTSDAADDGGQSALVPIAAAGAIAGGLALVGLAFALRVRRPRGGPPPGER